MEEQKTKKAIDVQAILSLGYIYVLLLGIIHNALYYGYFDVNYLEYSSILDVLISPIGIITSSIKTLIAFFGVILVAFLYIKIALPFVVKKRRKKQLSEKKLKGLEKLEKLSSGYNGLLFFVGLYIFMFFIGIGNGKGNRNYDKIINDKIEHNHKIQFIDGKIIDVKLLGKNSLNIFYIQKGEKEISISPIEGNIRSIKKLKKN